MQLQLLRYPKSETSSLTVVPAQLPETVFTPGMIFEPGRMIGLGLAGQTGQHAHLLAQKKPEQGTMQPGSNNLLVTSEQRDAAFDQSGSP